MPKNYKITLSEETRSKIDSYLTRIKQYGGDLSQIIGDRLFEEIQSQVGSSNLQAINQFIRSLETDNFLNLLLNTKKPKSFAESVVLNSRDANKTEISDAKNEAGWSTDEVDILEDVAICVSIIFYDNGGQKESQKKHQDPFQGELLYMPGPVFSGRAAKHLKTYQQIIHNDKFKEEEFIVTMKKKLLLLFLHANENSTPENPAFITVPGISYGTKEVPKALNKAIKQLLEEHHRSLPNIAGIHLDTFATESLGEDEDLERENIGHIIYRKQELEIDHGRDGTRKQQLDKPENFDKRFDKCKLFSVVAADALSWPGNDMNVGSRATDEEEKTGATNAMTVMTGIEGSYGDIERVYSLEGNATAENYILANKIRIETNGRIELFNNHGLVDVDRNSKKRGAGSPSLRQQTSLEEQEIVKHIKKRFNELERILENNPQTRIIIAGRKDKIGHDQGLESLDDNNRYGQNGHNLGTGLAKDQWKENVIGWKKSIEVTNLRVQILLNDYSNRVSIGNVGYSTQGQYKVEQIPSAQCIHVWGANADNWNVSPGESFSGSGQAAAMSKQKQQIGCFGIVTTPFCGVKGLDAIDKTHEGINKKKGSAKEGGKTRDPKKQEVKRDKDDQTRKKTEQKNQEDAERKAKNDQIRDSIDPIIRRYIDDNHTAETEGLKQFKEGIKSQKNKPNPDSSYRGIGLEVKILEGRGLDIVKIFSLNVQRFNVVGQNPLNQHTLRQKVITHVSMVDPEDNKKKYYDVTKLSDEQIASAFHAEDQILFKLEGENYEISCDNTKNKSAIFSPVQEGTGQRPNFYALSGLLGLEYDRPDLAKESIDASKAKTHTRSPSKTPEPKMVQLLNSTVPIHSTEV